MVDSINGEVNGYVPTAVRRPVNRPVNVPCSLLSCEENSLLFQLIGHDRYTLATAVVQVLLSEPPLHMRWILHQTGVVCFIKDYCHRSYFFRLYSLKTGLLWEQEFYRGFQYNVVTPLFHCFEGSDSMAGFSFADVTDALQFSRVVIAKIEDKRAKLNRKKERQQLLYREDGNSERSVPVSQGSPPNSVVNISAVDEKGAAELSPSLYHVEPAGQRRSSSPMNAPARGFMSLREKGTLRRRKLSKSEISNPISCTFEHREHIGIDGVRYGVNGSKENSTPSADFSEMLLIFQHRFPDLRECELSEVIDKYGGLDRLRNELRLGDAAESCHFEPQKQRRPAPPPPPAPVVQSARLTVTRAAPTPPQKPKGRPSLRPPNPPELRPAPSHPAEQKIPSPPPLPPPLPPVLGARPVAKGKTNEVRPAAKKPTERSLLLSELSNPETRRRLKPVGPAQPKTSSPSDSRDNLLDAIRQFDRTKLKPASDDKSSLQDSLSSAGTSPIVPCKNASTSSRSDDARTVSPAASSKSAGGSMMDQIKQELERRRRMMVNTDFNGDDDDATGWSNGNHVDSDDEWTSGDKHTQSSNSSLAAF